MRSAADDTRGIPPLLADLWKRCPECDGWGRTIKTKDNATEVGPMGMQQKCVRCGGTGAVRR